MFTRDKSREMWLLHRDKNTAFFHASIKDKHRTTISEIKLSNGATTGDPNDIIDEVVTHFESRFTVGYFQ